MNKIVFNAYLANKINVDEMYRYQALKRELFGSDMFVEPDDTDPRWREYDRIKKKIHN